MGEDELRERLDALEGKVARIGELEAEVARLREDAATARALPGSTEAIRRQMAFVQVNGIIRTSGSRTFEV